LCKAVGDPRRLEILRVLSVDSYGVLELAHLFDMPQPGISHHLKILTAAGLLVARREGNSIFYRRALVPTDHPLAALQLALYRAIDPLALSQPIEARIADVHRDRAAHSREFFRRNAEGFRQNQELIARLSQYDKPVEDLISHDRINGAGTVMEVGPGEGELLPLLSRLFSRVIALDNSPEMLERARRSVAEEGHSNVQFIDGEISRAVAKKIKVDLLILNMVLHHMASPSSVFQEARQLLRAGSAFLIIDLCRHDQDWARDSCGDLWLGFDPDDLEIWANRADLRRAQSIYLALRNGFQIQMQLFRCREHSAPATRTLGSVVKPGAR
jgi:ArsR family transcriptional regulator